MRARIGYRVWRARALAARTWLAGRALLHGLGTGSDTRTGCHGRVSGLVAVLAVVGPSRCAPGP